jgi:arylsulfatase
MLSLLCGALMACVITSAITAQQPAAGSAKKPNVLVIWGDDIGTWNISHNSRGMMGYTTPNIDRIADEGISFTDYYAQQSCTAGRAAFLSGSVPVRSGMTKVGLPGAAQGWQKTDITVGGVMKSLGYHTGQFGKNHQGDRDEHLPTMHGFDEFFGPLYHLNASEEPEQRDYPSDMKLPNGKTFLETYGPRGVLKCKADGKGGQTIEDTGPLTIKRMEVDSDDTWTLPLGGGVGKVFKIGHQMVNCSMQTYYNVVTPDFGPEWTLRFQFTLVFPQ